MRMFNVGRGLLKSGAPGAADRMTPAAPAPAAGKGLTGLSPQHRRTVILGLGGLVVIAAVWFLLAPKPVPPRPPLAMRPAAPAAPAQAPRVAPLPPLAKKAEEGGARAGSGPPSKAEGRPVEGVAKVPVEAKREQVAKAPETKVPPPAKAPPPAAPAPASKAEGIAARPAKAPAAPATGVAVAPAKGGETKAPAPAKAPPTKAPAPEAPRVASLPPEAKTAPARPSAEPPRAAERGKPSYALQVAAMAREENALALKGTLEAAGYPARIVRGAGVARRYKVYVGSYATQEEGEDAGRRLNVDGFPSTVARVGDRFSLEVGSFASEDDAIDLARELQVKNYPTKIGAQRGPSAIFHVRLGAFASLKDARKQGEELKAKGFTAVVVKQ